LGLNLFCAKHAGSSCSIAKISEIAQFGNCGFAYRADAIVGRLRVAMPTVTLPNLSQPNPDAPNPFS
jgi:hypothetical protein